MKLLIAIVNKRDIQHLTDALIDNDFRFTEIGSTGGFLRAGNVTLLIGVDDERVPPVLELIQNHCHAREEAIDDLKRDLDSIFPGVAGQVIEADIAHWALANPKWRVGHTDIYPALQAPAGAIHFCGDYTSPGYMNGSVLSAYRVAAELDAAQ